MNPLNQLLTVPQLANFLQVSTETVYRWSSEGRIPRIKLGGNLVRFELDKVNKWLTTMEKKGRASRRIPVEGYSEPG